MNNGQVTHTYTNLSKGKWKKKGNSRLALKTKNEYHLTREYRKQGDFPQTISYTTDINGDVVNNVALVQYTFTGTRPRPNCSWKCQKKEGLYQNKTFCSTKTQRKSCALSCKRGGSENKTRTRWASYRKFRC